MARFLIVYDTSEGQTAKIARELAAQLTSKAHDADVRDVRDLPRKLSLDAFDAVVIGASIHFGKHSSRIGKFVRRHVDHLAKRPSAFFSVSLWAANRQPGDSKRADEETQRFFDSTGWHPPLSAVFAGALRYRDYGWLKRLMMRRIAARSGGATDTSCNHEYTSWRQVQLFADALTHLVGADTGD